MRHGIEEHLLEVVQGIIDLIKHGGLELVQFVSAPPESDLLLQLRAQSLLFIGSQRAVQLQLLDQGRHPPLLVAHGVTHDLGGVGREHQTDVELPQQVFQLGWRHIEGPQSLKQLAKRGRGTLGSQGRQEGIAAGGGRGAAQAF